MDASMSYQNYQQSKQDPGFVPDVPLEELIKIKEGL